MPEFYTEGACHTITHFYSFQSRLQFEDIKEAPSPKPGIRYHHFIVAFILQLFSDKKIVTIKDVKDKIYYINREELTDWLKRNERNLQNYPKEELYKLIEHDLRGWLERFLKRQSPQYILDLCALKNDLVNLEKNRKAALNAGPMRFQEFEKAVRNCKIKIQNAEEEMNKKRKENEEIKKEQDQAKMRKIVNNQL